MQQSIIKAISETHTLLSTGRALQVLYNSKVHKTINFSSKVSFITFSNLTGISQSNEKTLLFYPLSLLTGKDELKDDLADQQPKYLYTNWKKISAIRGVKFEGVEGVLIADKTGDIQFLNYCNLEKLG